MNHPPHFGRLLRHLRETAGVTRDEAASIVGMDGRKYHEIEMGKGSRTWPSTPESMKALDVLLKRFDASGYFLTLWHVRMRRRENFHYRFRDLPVSIQADLIEWEVMTKVDEIDFYKDASKVCENRLQEKIQEILERKPAPDSIPDNE